MVRLVVVVFATLAMSGAFHAEASDEALAVTLLWKASIDAQGHVIGLEPRSEANEVLLGKLGGVVRKWEFEPGKVNGRPAPTETTLRVAVRLEPAQDGNSFRVRLMSAATGGALGKIGNVPSLSSAEWRGVGRSGGRVVVLARYDEKGKVVDASVWRDSPIRKGALASSAVRAVKTWEFLPERVAGMGVAAEVLQPVCFVDSSDACKDDDGEGTSESVGDVALALDSQVRLKSDVIGSIL